MVLQKNDKTSYSVIGAMAGSSMDGLDLAHVIFKKEDDRWAYQLRKCETIRYPLTIYESLRDSEKLDKQHQNQLDVEFGTWIGKAINVFKDGLGEIDILGVHGHTVIHDPQKKISWQLGKGSTIASLTNTITVTDFRSTDVELGGQGAPLVPYGDFNLFQEYDVCLNLGGIANISIRQNQQAWDICPCNQVLNYFAARLDQSYDENGNLARKGEIDSALKKKISSISYFELPPPKSLPNNFIDLEILNKVNPTDGLHTYAHIIAEQIHKSLPHLSSGKILVTGGGAHNGFLIELIKKYSADWQVILPDTRIIDFKESLVFALLALLRIRNKVNVLASVTGASKDSSSGVIHLP